ncbi:uncharacterized protein B0P05DRAFT_467108 [Gilbertella persicaria]|nr:uncharacterized protein B0P05DRAFT_467108 [Gilbertella persicaria]KAI8084163.1 hypothetical protein B0P05DRAFT_467108 [Gilbertella persicaria]
MTHHSQKVFSFVPLPGLNQKKRPRRKFHEVERLYQCNFQDCTKAYGTLNHLNAHVSMQRHGPKRQPSEFKELRKMWRKQKRDNKQRFNSLKTPPLTDSTPVDSNDDILNHSNSDYMLPPPPSSGSSFMHQQQTYPTNTHWMHRPSYPPPSTHFMPSGY